ncbi:outer membrane beta-barrel protein [Chitinophagaceae bacterium MMS25-I14]
MRNRMLHSILALCISTAAVTTVKAQTPQEMIEPSGWALGMNVGLSDLWGDVGTKSAIDHYSNSQYIKKPMFMGGLYGRYSIHPSFDIRLGVNYGTLYATDKWNEHNANKATSLTDDAYQRYTRNQDAKTNIWEGSLLFEVSPFRFNLHSKLARKSFQPYIMFGVAAFHFNPQTTYMDPVTRETKWVKIYDLHLEGDGFNFEGAPKKYNLWQMAIPLGIGARWDIGNQLGLGIEYTYRMTFTDYLDGVSDRYIDPALYDQYLPADKAALAKSVSDKTWEITDPNYRHQPGEIRGNKSVKDGYSTISITLFYKIKRKTMPWWY